MERSGCWSLLTREIGSIGGRARESSSVSVGDAGPIFRPATLSGAMLRTRLVLLCCLEGTGSRKSNLSARYRIESARIEVRRVAARLSLHCKQ